MLGMGRRRAYYRFLHPALDRNSPFVGARGTDTSATGALNTTRVPGIGLDRRGFAAGVKAAADTVFDNDVQTWREVAAAA
jgi:hypothetical protein